MAFAAAGGDSWFESGNAQLMHAMPAPFAATINLSQDSCPSHSTRPAGHAAGASGVGGQVLDGHLPQHGCQGGGAARGRVSPPRLWQHGTACAGQPPHLDPCTAPCCAPLLPACLRFSLLLVCPSSPPPSDCPHFLLAKP